MFQEKNNSKQQVRSIARQLARELNPEEMDSIAAGTTTCSRGVGCDDSDRDPD